MTDKRRSVPYADARLKGVAHRMRSAAPCRATDLALRTTKATALAIGRSMSSLIVLEHHLWLTVTEMKEADKVPFRDAPVLSGSRGSAVERFAERLSSEVVSADATLP